MILSPEEFPSKNHSCTLRTIISIEHFIEKNSGLYSKTELWKALPKKIMYQSYKVVLTHLISIGKITTQGKKVVWVGKKSFSLEQFEAQHHNSTLTTLSNIYNFLRENSGQYSKTQAWENLPNKMMYQSYKVALAYLVDCGAVEIVERKLVVRGDKQ